MNKLIKNNINSYEETFELTLHRLLCVNYILEPHKGHVPPSLTITHLLQL